MCVCVCVFRFGPCNAVVMVMVVAVLVVLLTFQIINTEMLLCCCQPDFRHFHPIEVRSDFVAML